MHITPEGQQLIALDRITKWIKSGSRRRFILSGYAGTGKTSLVPHIRNITYENDAVVAYTNKAASVLRSKGITDATTIFRIMYDLIDEENMIWRRRMELPFDRVIVDESSMIGSKIRDDLESYGVPILYTGDSFQLGPIGDNEVSIMAHPDYELTEIRRQAADSPIIKIATAIREGRRYDDVDQYGLKIDEIAKYDVVLCYTNRRRFDLNRRIRAYHGKGPNPEVGDRVVMMRTEYDYGLGAGECGTILATNGKWKSTILFDGELLPVNFVKCHFMQEGENPYDRDLGGRQCLDYAYASTVHKAQGSAYNKVLVWVEPRSDARWLYTAVTRAIDEVLVAGR